MNFSHPHCFPVHGDHCDPWPRGHCSSLLMSLPPPSLVTFPCWFSNGSRSNAVNSESGSCRLCKGRFRSRLRHCAAWWQPQHRQDKRKGRGCVPTGEGLQTQARRACLSLHTSSPRLDTPLHLGFLLPGSLFGGRRRLVMRESLKQVFNIAK